MTDEEIAAQKEADEAKEGFQFELTDEAVTELEAEVLAAHTGKTKDQLTDEIEAAKVERLQKLTDDSKPLFDEVTKLKELEENKDKTNEELIELAEASIEAAGTGDDDKLSDLDDDFVGIGRQAAKPVVDENGNQTPDPVTLPDDVQARLKKLDRIESDTLLSAYINDDGDDFINFIQNSGVAQNSKRIPADRLYEANLRERQKQFPEITNEEIEESMQSFRALPRTEQLEKAEPLRAQFEAEQKAVLSKFSNNAAAKAKVSQEAQKVLVNEATQELNDNYLGKVYNGVKIDATVVKNVITEIKKGNLSFKNPDGSPDVVKTIEAQIILDNHYAMIDSAHKRGQKVSSRKNAIKTGKPQASLRIKGAATAAPKADRDKELKKAKEKRYGASA